MSDFSELETLDRSSGTTTREQIGPYKLLQRIGEGGFGSVYEAEQEQPVKRHVALKIIKVGMDTHMVIARFEAERQALAMMDHPHVAHVLDAGATETGRPYFVMELVKGEPITAYCDKHKLSVVDRLKLFDQVCVAVQHAHIKGIIHRDLKPSNVLVSTQDDAPFAKVIDFGIAKATTGRLTDNTLTAMHQLVGTPIYMSPEQAEGSSDVDTRTDIYSLGVLLYELLTGTTPLEPASLKTATTQEFQRLMREVVPRRPSARLTASGGTLVDVASRRGSEPQKLTAILSGGLDWIVMKAIEKERSRRYETANDFAMDIRRYLAGEPVLAAPPSASYRLRKFVGRHRIAVAAGSLVVASLVLGIIGTTVGMVRAERQQHAAEKVSDFMKEILKGAGPSVARGRDTTMMKEMMDQAAARIERGELRDAPEAEIDLRLAIGESQYALAEYDAANRLLEPAVEMARQRHGANHPKVGEALLQLGYLRTEQGKYPEAEALLRKALEIRKKSVGPRTSEVADTLGYIGVTLALQNKFAEADSMLREAVALSRATRGTENRNHSTLLNGLAVTLRKEGKLAESEAMYREALAISRRVTGDPSVDVAETLNNLAVVLYSEDKLPEAEARYREALAMNRKILGENHPRVAENLNGLAIVMTEQGKHAEAELLLREALAMMRKLLGNDHVNVGRNLENLVHALLPQKKYAEAESFAREATAIADRANPGSRDAAKPRVNLGRALTGNGRYAEAEQTLLEANRIQVSEGVPAAEQKDCFRALASLYSSWNKASPGHGYDAKAAEWQRKLDAMSTPQTAPSAASSATKR